MMAAGGLPSNDATSVDLHPSATADGVVEVCLPQAGGFCVVASSAVTRVDFLFDFVALRWCLGADSAAAVGAVFSPG